MTHCCHTCHPIPPQNKQVQPATELQLLNQQRLELTLNHKGCVLGVNEGANRSIFGVDPADLLGRSVASFINVFGQWRAKFGSEDGLLTMLAMQVMQNHEVTVRVGLHTPFSDAEITQRYGTCSGGGAGHDTSATAAAAAAMGGGSGDGGQRSSMPSGNGSAAGNMLLTALKSRTKERAAVMTLFMVHASEEEGGGGLAAAATAVTAAAGGAGEAALLAGTATGGLQIGDSRGALSCKCRLLAGGALSVCACPDKPQACCLQLCQDRHHATAGFAGMGLIGLWMTCSPCAPPAAGANNCCCCPGVPLPGAAADSIPLLKVCLWRADGLTSHIELDAKLGVTRTDTCAGLIFGINPAALLHKSYKK
jgi:hypothetical protein